MRLRTPLGDLIIQARWRKHPPRQWYCPEGFTRRCVTRPQRYLTRDGRCPGCGRSLVRV